MTLPPCERGGTCPQVLWWRRPCNKETYILTHAIDQVDRWRHAIVVYIVELFCLIVSKNALKKSNRVNQLIYGLPRLARIHYTGTYSDGAPGIGVI